MLVFVSMISSEIPCEACMPNIGKPLPSMEEQKYFKSNIYIYIYFLKIRLQLKLSYTPSVILYLTLSGAFKKKNLELESPNLLPTGFSCRFCVHSRHLYYCEN